MLLAWCALIGKERSSQQPQNSRYTQHHKEYYNPPEEKGFPLLHAAFAAELEDISRQAIEICRERKGDNNY